MAIFDSNQDIFKLLELGCAGPSEEKFETAQMLDVLLVRAVRRDHAFRRHRPARLRGGARAALPARDALVVPARRPQPRRAGAAAARASCSRRPRRGPTRRRGRATSGCARVAAARRAQPVVPRLGGLPAAAAAAATEVRHALPSLAEARAAFALDDWQWGREFRGCEDLAQRRLLEALPRAPRRRRRWRRRGRRRPRPTRPAPTRSPRPRATRRSSTGATPRCSGRGLLRRRPRRAQPSARTAGSTRCSRASTSARSRRTSRAPPPPRAATPPTPPTPPPPPPPPPSPATRPPPRAATPPPKPPSPAPCASPSSARATGGSRAAPRARARDRGGEIELTASDSRASRRPRLAAAADDGGALVERLDFRAALRRHRPHIVLVAWMPMGADWSAAIRAEPGVRECVRPRAPPALPTRAPETPPRPARASLSPALARSLSLSQTSWKPRHARPRPKTTRRALHRHHTTLRGFFGRGLSGVLVGEADDGCCGHQLAHFRQPRLPRRPNPRRVRARAAPAGADAGRRRRAARAVRAAPAVVARGQRGRAAQARAGRRRRRRRRSARRRRAVRGGRLQAARARAPLAAPALALRLRVVRRQLAHGRVPAARRARARAAHRRRRRGRGRGYAARAAAAPGAAAGVGESGGGRRSRPGGARHRVAPTGAPRAEAGGRSGRRGRRVARRPVRTSSAVRCQKQARWHWHAKHNPRLHAPWRSLAR